MPAGTEASREELNALGDSLREAISSDRAERIEHLTRIETKFDTRMDAFYKMLTDYKEKTGDQSARLSVLEKAVSDLLAGNASRFEQVQRETGQRIADLIAATNQRFVDNGTTTNERIAKIEHKQDRNWNWVMGLVGAILMLMATQLATYMTRKDAVVKQVDHVHDATGKEIPVPKAVVE